MLAAARIGEQSSGKVRLLELKIAGFKCFSVCAGNSNELDLVRASTRDHF
jgi:hypothetical protein